MVAGSYTPDVGDIVWTDFDPVRGHEQGKHRPALVVSPKDYNQKSKLALMCPITSKVKPYPFVVPISTGDIKGVILSDQIKSFDWQERGVKFIGKADAVTIKIVRKNLTALIRG